MDTLQKADKLCTYKLIGTLGKGTYGTCYKAFKRSSTHRNYVVVKVIPLAGLSAKDVADSCREAHLLKLLQHPQIVKYRDAWMEQDNIY